tara:strand:- start:2503 stop:3180 length:678 start_codon:yes stop_codon:yes gene_type:complete
MDNIIPDDFTDDIEEEVEEKWYKQPLTIILGVFMGLLVVLMVVPYYGVQLDPSPSQIPSINDVIPSGNEAGNETILGGNIYEYRTLVDGSDKVVKLVADRVVRAACHSGERVCQAKAIFYFVRDNFDYVSDPLAYEYVKSPRLSLASSNGDCDDSSVLMASLLESIGIRTRFVFVPQHVYVQALIPEALKRYQDNGWVNLDGTCGSCDFGEIAFAYVNSEKRFVE